MNEIKYEIEVHLRQKNALVLTPLGLSNLSVQSE